MSNPGNTEAQAPVQEAVADDVTTVAAVVEKTEAETPDPEVKPDEVPVEGAEVVETEEQKTKSRVKREKQKAKFEALEAENRRLAEIVASTERTKPISDTLGPKPDPSKYEDEREYTADLAAWKTEERLLARQRNTYEANSVNARNDEAAGRKALFHERVMALKETHPDIESVFSQEKLPISGGMAEAIMESPKGPELAYHLANNPTDFQRIQAMSQGAALMELGRLEAKLGLPKPRTETKAPPPPSTVSGSVKGPNKRPEDMSMAEYSAWRAKGGGE